MTQAHFQRGSRGDNGRFGLCVCVIVKSFLLARLTEMQEQALLQIAMEIFSQSWCLNCPCFAPSVGADFKKNQRIKAKGLGMRHLLQDNRDVSMMLMFHS